MTRSNRGSQIAQELSTRPSVPKSAPILVPWRVKTTRVVAPVVTKAQALTPLRLRKAVPTFQPPIVACDGILDLIGNGIRFWTAFGWESGDWLAPTRRSKQPGGRVDLVWAHALLLLYPPEPTANRSATNLTLS